VGARAATAGHASSSGPSDTGRPGALAAWGSAAVGLGGVAVALTMAPWFVWTEHALSDLGHPSRESAAVFNAALVASGALNLVFVSVVYGRLPAGAAGRAAGAALAAGGVSLAAVGAVNESFGVAHLLVSITYFTFVATGIVLVGVALRRQAPRFARASVAVGATAGAFGLSVSAAVVYRAPFTSQAIPELIASLVFAAWTVWVGYALWAGTFPATRPAPP